MLSSFGKSWLELGDGFCFSSGVGSLFCHSLHHSLFPCPHPGIRTHSQCLGRISLNSSTHSLVHPTALHKLLLQAGPTVGAW